MKEFPVSTRYTAAGWKQLDRPEKAVGMSRSDLIHARALGKVVTTHQLARNAERKGRRVSRAA